jgi:4-alpha-glucanotransferase
MLRALKDRWPEMPFLAEDLGVITDEVRELRDDFGLPGMVILQFAFGLDPDTPWVGDHPYLPHNHRAEQVCYTGTHDNDTALGWFQGTDDGTRDLVRRYLQIDDREMPWALLVAAWRSVANTAIVPMQDLLGHGADARMNIPGTAEGNWSWRMPAEAMNLALASRLMEQVQLSGRLGLAPEED